MIVPAFIIIVGCIKIGEYIEKHIGSTDNAQ